MDQATRNYLAQIGRKGGKKSRRVLASKEAQDMVRVREARRAFKKFSASCFWSFDPTYRVQKSDIPWVAEQLKKNGNQEAWKVAERLCR